MNFATVVFVRCRVIDILHFDNTCWAPTAALRRQVAENCRELLAVRLFGCTLLSDDAVGQLATHCRGLRALKMSGCPLLTDRTLHTLGEHGQFLVLFFSSLRLSPGLSYFGEELCMRMGVD